MKELKLISKKTLDTIIGEAMEYIEEKDYKTGEIGGNFYDTFNSRISPAFTKAVIISTESGDIEYTYAFRLLGGIKGKTYDEIRGRILPYG